VVAAAAVGLCASSDGGATWVVEKAGLHAPHCSAVQFVGDDVLVSEAVDPFAPQGAIYRRGLDEHCPLVKVAGGLPEWLDGKVDTGCIATHGSAVALADMGGNICVSADTSRTWSRQADRYSNSEQRPNRLRTGAGLRVLGNKHGCRTIADPILRTRQLLEPCLETSSRPISSPNFTISKPWSSA
jgi:hypothetical protein